MRTVRRLPYLTVLLLWASWPLGAAMAQLDDSRSEAEVTAFDLEAEEERESLIEEAARGPEAQQSWFREQVDLASLERTDTAITQLRRLVESTPRREAQRAEYMFRLAELFYQRATFYEQRAFQRRDEAFLIRDENPARARAFEQRANDDLAQSNQFADEAIRLYEQIVQDHLETYDQIDAVLFFLGANLSQLGRNEEARAVFELLVQTYPRSEYVPNALLALGEYHFLQGEMLPAYQYFEAVAAFTERPTFGYAVYKQAWALYNLAETRQDYEDAVELLFVAIEAASRDGRSGSARLRRDALRDMTLFYSEVFPADRAFAFFEAIAPEDVDDLMARLARIYGERGQYEDSNRIYRELMARNQDSFVVVEHQREIVRNTRPGGNNADLVRETRRLVELFDVARSFADASEGRVSRMENSLELLLRQMATTFHREAQVTLNEELYAMAYNLYRDYARFFGDTSQYAYVMWFYLGELLYRNEDWEEAAVAYERALAAADGDDRYDADAVEGACYASLRMVDIERSIQASGGGQAAQDEADLPPVPVPREIPPGYMRMMDACDRYLAVNPDPEKAVEIDYVVAFMYYDFDHLEEAARRFGELAVRFADVDAPRAQVAAELMLDSLALQRDYTSMREWITRFRASPLNHGEFAVRLALLSEQITFRECRQLQEAEQHEEAGPCFVAFVEDHFESTLVDRALYNAGLSFEAIDNIDFALSVYGYLIDLRPDSELVPDTILELARTYHRLAIYDEAAALYERYVQVSPRGEHVVNALANAGQFRAGLGQHEDAIRVLQAFIRAARDDDSLGPEAIAEANFQIALMEEERGRTRNASQAYEQFMTQHAAAHPSRGLEALVRLAALHEDQGRADRALRQYRATLDFFDGLDAESRARLSDAALDAVAKAQFMIGEEIFARFEAVPLTGTEAQQQAAIVQKLELGNQARAEYDRVLELNRPGWQIAAFMRLGQLYHVFFDQLISAPIPNFGDPLMEEQYRLQLEEQAEQQKLVAADRYIRAIEVARRTGWFNEFSFEAARLLQELDPSFRAGVEIRTEPGYDRVSFYTSGLVTDFGDDSPRRLGGGSADAGAPAQED